MTGIDRKQLATIRFNGIGYEEDLPGSFNLLQTQDSYEDNFGEQYGIMPWANGPDMSAVKEELANLGAYSFTVVPVENVGWEKD